MMKLDPGIGNLRKLDIGDMPDVTPPSLAGLFTVVGLFTVTVVVLLALCSKKKEETKPLAPLRSEDFEPSQTVASHRKTQKMTVKANVGTAGETSTAYYSVKLPGTGNILAVKSAGLVSSHKSSVTPEDRKEVSQIRQYARSMIPSMGNQSVQTVTTQLVERALSAKTERKLIKMKGTLIEAIITATEETLGYQEYPDADHNVKDEEFIRKDSKGALINLIPMDAYLEKLRQCVNQWTEDDDKNATSMGAKCLVISHIYLARMKKNTPDLEITSDNARNLYLISVMLATKFLDDWVIPVRFWAELVSCKASVLNEMESKFSKQMNYDFFVSQARLDKTVSSLYKRVK